MVFTSLFSAIKNIQTAQEALSRIVRKYLEPLCVFFIGSPHTTLDQGKYSRCIA